MTTIKNLYTTNINSKITSKPTSGLDGKIYTKSDGLLYYLTPSNVEFVLSVSQVSQTLDYLYALNNNVNATPLNIPWNSTLAVENNVSVSVADNSIINIGTTGLYMVTYGKTVTDSDSSDGNFVESHIILNNNNSNSYLRHGSDENAVLHNAGVVRYITECVGIITASTNSVINTVVNATSMFNGSVTANEQPRLNIHKIDNSNYLNAKSINNANVSTGVLLNVNWNTPIVSNGALSSLNNVVTTTQPGLYFVLYNIEWEGSGIATTPTLESYILVDDTDTFRYASDSSTIMANGGTLRYSKSVSSIIPLSANQNIRLKALQTTGVSLSFSGATVDEYKHTNLYVLKLAEIAVAIATINPVTLTPGTTALSLVSSVATDTTIVGDTITFNTAGTYLISYNIEIDGIGAGSPPSFESYLSGDVGVTKYGYLSEVLLVSGGVLRYSLAKSTKVAITAGGTLKWYFTNTTGGNVTGSANNNKQMRISCVKVY
jgi:hypothetical protein